MKSHLGELNVVLAGEAGQGLQTAGDILVRACVRSGYSVCTSQTYESRIRGGHNTFSIRIHARRALAPREPIDLLVALNPEAARRHLDELSSHGVALVPEDFPPSRSRVSKVPYHDLGTEGFINMAALGVASSLIGLKMQSVQKALEDLSAGASPHRIEKDINSLQKAYDWALKLQKTLPRLRSPAARKTRLVLNGNEAIALGALSAGVKFCSFYPMSPSTTIAINLAQWAQRMGIVVEQAEDEIAAINMCIGASYAGVPSLVPTSGGGFALMVESVSLSAMSETPIVVVVAQRPGPATGLPTRTEQGDLLFVINSGHGEFPKAVFAPASPQDCFHITRAAVETAERYQVPVFILSDHFLADSQRDVEPFDLEGLSQVSPGADPSSIPTPYLRYRITEDGVSPRLLPGLGEELVIGDSHEHSEDGHITEDLTLRPKMVKKRMRKLLGITKEAIPPTLLGDKRPEVLLLCWGSTLGAAQEAMEEMREGGVKAGVMHFSQVWPLDGGKILQPLHSAQRVICVEGNSTGQLASIIRMTTGFEIEEMVLRYDGLPITPEYIIRGASL
jgi:2-oxoglutarate ferredoxin oxidoreductase subunit alpha